MSRNFWACPNCRYLVGHNVILQGEHYYPCPRCNRTTLVDFIPAHEVRLKFVYAEIERKIIVTGRLMAKLPKVFGEIFEAIIKLALPDDGEE